MSPPGLSNGCGDQLISEQSIHRELIPEENAGEVRLVAVCSDAHRHFDSGAAMGPKGATVAAALSKSRRSLALAQ